MRQVRRVKALVQLQAQAEMWRAQAEASASSWQAWRG